MYFRLSKCAKIFFKFWIYAMNNPFSTKNEYHAALFALFQYFINLFFLAYEYFWSDDFDKTFGQPWFTGCMAGHLVALLLCSKTNLEKTKLWILDLVDPPLATAISKFLHSSVSLSASPIVVEESFPTFLQCFHDSNLCKL